MSLSVHLLISSPRESLSHRTLAHSGDHQFKNPLPVWYTRTRTHTKLYLTEHLKLCILAIFISLCITETLISIQHCATCLITTKSSKEPSKKNTIISTLQVRKLRCGDLKRLLKVTPRVNDKVWCSIQICDSQSHALPIRNHIVSLFEMYFYRGGKIKERLCCPFKKRCETAW